MNIIDSFMFFNEFEILKLRLSYLNDVVDHFIISECKYTHSGNPKPYHLDEVFDQIPDEIRKKIIRLKYEPRIDQMSFPENVTEGNYDNSYWELERGQRDLITTKLANFDNNDIFMVSDVDEIPRKEAIVEATNKLRNPSGPRTLVSKCDMFYYNFSTWCNNVWGGTVFSTVKTARGLGCDYLRMKRFELSPIDNGGWHFSYFGGVDMIRKKIESFAHQEYNKNEYKDEDSIRNAIKNKKDIFHRSGEFKEYPFSQFPEDLKNSIKQSFSSDYYQDYNMSINTRPEYLHNNMPPLLEAILNPDGTGGTEIMGRAWQDYVLPVVPDLADWHWCVIPGDNQLSPDSSNIVWLHPHHMEEGIERLLDKEFQKHFRAYVFVSNWQYERFGERLQLPLEKCYVLKNAINPIPVHKKPEGKLQLIFHPNPIRGLDILLESIRLLPEEDFDLHIFHELDPHERKIQYSQGVQTYEYAHVSPQEEQFLRYCLDLADRDRRVVRHTRTNNSKVREQLLKTHIFAYPSYFMETSCICMIEALAAGCSVLTSNLAALPETGLGFARHYGFIPDRKAHIERFSRELKKTLVEYRMGKFDGTQQVQKINDYYSWDTRVNDWVEFSKELWLKS